MIATEASDQTRERSVVVDTSAWIECFAESELGRQIRPALPPLPLCIVPTIVQHEIEKWALRNLTPEQREIMERRLQVCPIDHLDTLTAKAAAKINLAHKLASADALIYATARKFNVEVITCDAHFKDLPAVRFFPKRNEKTAAPSGDWNGWPTSAKMLAAIQ